MALRSASWLMIAALTALTVLTSSALAQQPGPGPVPSGTYSLPTATASTLGGVKPDGTTIGNAAGAISVTYGTGSNTAAQGNDSRITGALPTSGGTMTGELITPASATGGAGFNLPPGTAPTSPVNGDCWTTSAGLYCRVNGATVGPYASSAGSSGPVLLATLTASNSASLTNTTSLTATYKSYEFRLINILPASNGDQMAALVSTNGGSSYDSTTANYNNSDTLVNFYSAASGSNPQGATMLFGLFYQRNTITNNSSTGLNGVLTLYAPSATGDKFADYRLSWTSNVSSASSMNHTTGSTLYLGSTSPINAIEFKFVNGNIASGSIEIWGIP